MIAFNSCDAQEHAKSSHGKTGATSEEGGGRSSYRFAEPESPRK